MAKKNSNLQNVEDTMKVGVGSMAGHYALGAMGSLPGMPAQAQGTLKVANAGITLANVGQLAKTGMGLVSNLGQQAKTTVKKEVKTLKKAKKKVDNYAEERIRRILG